MLLECINKNGDQFKTYMLAFVRDRDYERIIEAVNKVDKTFNETTNPSTHNPALVPRIPSPVPAVPVNPYMQSFSFLSVPPCWGDEIGFVHGNFSALRANSGYACVL